MKRRHIEVTDRNFVRNFGHIHMRRKEMAAISNDWLEPISVEFKKPYYKQLYENQVIEDI